MGVFAEGGKGFDGGALCCSMLSFVRTQMLPFSTLVHQAFMPVPQPSMSPPPHHCKPSSVICWLFCVSVKLTITRSVPQSCSESIWLDGVTHLPVIFPYAFSEIWNRVTHCGLSPATPPPHTQMDTKREPWCFSSPAAFKASLDRLDCFWKTFF